MSGQGGCQSREREADGWARTRDRLELGALLDGRLLELLEEALELGLLLALDLGPALLLLAPPLVLLLARPALRSDRLCPLSVPRRLLSLVSLARGPLLGLEPVLVRLLGQRRVALALARQLERVVLGLAREPVGLVLCLLGRLELVLLLLLGRLEDVQRAREREREEVGEVAEGVSVVRASTAGEGGLRVEAGRTLASRSALRSALAFSCRSRSPRRARGRGGETGWQEQGEGARGQLEPSRRRRRVPGARAARERRVLRPVWDDAPCRPSP